MVWSFSIVTTDLNIFTTIVTLRSTTENVAVYVWDNIVKELEGFKCQLYEVWV